MGRPDFTMQAGFASNPDDDPQVLSDLSDRLIDLQITAGRQSLQDRPEAGTSTATVDNNDRALDPTNTAGPYYPNVLPERVIVYQASLDGTTYDLAWHFADGWPQPWDTEYYATPTIAATDAFEALSAAQIPASAGDLPVELTGSRINRVLDAVGWAAGRRAIDAGQSETDALPFANIGTTDALTLILDAAADDIGLFYIDGSGNAVFQDRHHRLKAPYTISQATFSDDPAAGEFDYAALVCNYDRTLISNDVRVARTGGTTTETTEDATSIQRYRRRTTTYTPNLTSDTEAQDMADFLLYRYKNPYLRFEQLTLEPGVDSATWAQALTLKIGDRITVQRTPPGGGDPIVQDCHIEAVTIKLVPPGDETEGNMSQVTWRLSPADFTAYLVFDDATNGRFDFNAFAY